MKKATQVIGMPLMGVKEGTERGTAKDYVVDPQTKGVRSIILKWENSEYDFRELNTGDIMGIGKDYIITKSIENAKKIELTGVEMTLLGMKCIACTGDILGNIADFEFDEKTGELKTLEIDDGLTINGKDIVSISNNLMFVDSEGKAAAAVSETLSDYEKEQRDYMMGRTVSADVLNADGKAVIKKGTVVTEEVIRLAEEAGVSVDLTLNLE